MRMAIDIHLGDSLEAVRAFPVTAHLPFDGMKMGCTFTLSMDKDFNIEILIHISAPSQARVGLAM